MISVILAKVDGVIPHAEQVGNDNDDERPHAPARDALKSTADDEHAHAARYRTDYGADKVESDRKQQEWFPAPDVGQFRPDGPDGSGGNDI